MRNINDAFNEAFGAFCRERDILERIRETTAVGVEHEEEIKQKKAAQAAYNRMKKLDALLRACCAVEASLPRLRDPDTAIIHALMGKPRYRTH